LRRAVEGLTVPIHALLDDQQETEGVVLSPEDVTAIVTAFDATLSKLGLVDRKDDMTVTVAKVILQVAKDGERDPTKLCERVLNILGK
jgi:hypothetical protein